RHGYSQKVSAGISWRLEFFSGESLPDDQPGSNRRATRVVWWGKNPALNEMEKIEAEIPSYAFLEKKISTVFSMLFLSRSFCPCKLFVYDRFKRVQWLIARDFATIDKKGGSASKTKLGTLIQVLLHNGLILPARKAMIKRIDVKTDVFGVAFQIVGASLR